MANTMLTGEQLLSDLQKNKNKKVFLISGFVKLKDDESQDTMLFNLGNGSSKWVVVPISMIDSVEILGKTILDGQILTVANLFLNKPSSEEGSFLVDIVNLADQKNAISRGGENLGTGTLPLMGINDGTLPLMGINDGALPLRTAGVVSGISYANPIRWLGSWQVGNG